MNHAVPFGAAFFIAKKGVTLMALTASDIYRHLTSENLTVEVHKEVTSTNTLLKQRGHSGAPHGFVIVAESQTAGRGRMGREFFSPDQTGAYFSVLLRPNLSPSDSLLITTCAAVACAKALERISGKSAQIKWVNDIYMDNRKVCGILTEASFAQGKIDFAVLGIGINLYTPHNGFPTEIKDKAGSLFTLQDTDLRAVIIAEVLNEFFAMYESIEKRVFIEEYRSRSLLDGKRVNVIKSDCIIPATALYIDSDLSLAVRYENGNIEHLTSGDVSIGRL